MRRIDTFLLSLCLIFALAIIGLVLELVDTRDELAVAKQDTLDISGWYEDDLESCVKIDHPADMDYLK